MARHLLTEDAAFVVRETDLSLPIPPDAEAAYTLRPLTVEVARRIAQQHTQRVLNPTTFQKEETTDALATQNAQLDYVLTGWEGVRNGSDPAPCDLAHKLKLPAVVQLALLRAAQVGESEAARAASFRQSP